MWDIYSLCLVQNQKWNYFFVFLPQWIFLLLLLFDSYFGNKLLGNHSWCRELHFVLYLKSTRLIEFIFQALKENNNKHWLFLESEAAKCWHLNLNVFKGTTPWCILRFALVCTYLHLPRCYAWPAGRCSACVSLVSSPDCPECWTVGSGERTRTPATLTGRSSARSWCSCKEQSSYPRTRVPFLVADRGRKRDV